MRMNRKQLFLTAALACALFAGAHPAAGDDGGSKTAGMAWLEENFHTYDSLSKVIHTLAETGYHEHRSAEALISHLKSHGFVIEKGVAGIPTAFVATYGKGGPVIGILAEYDALNGMSQDTLPYPSPLVEGGNGHACGHNLIGTASTAAAVAISKWLAEGREGSVKLFGCPAEEGGGGKAYMTREGCFDGVDAMFDWHPADINMVNVAPGLANIRARFTFHGITAHASMAPEKGRSALDAVEAFDFMANLMREHVPMDARIHYVVTNGGQAPNIVPNLASVEYYVRHASRTVVQEIFDRLLKAAEGAALGTGTTFEYEIVNGSYEKIPNYALSDILQANLSRVGGVEYDRREREFALEVMRNSGITDTSLLAKARTVVPDYRAVNQFSWASSDVGNVSWVVPTGSIICATFIPECGGGHCWQQTAAGGTTIGTKGAMNCARVFYLTALELYLSPEKLSDVKAEFEQRRGSGFVFKPLVGDREPPLDYCRP